MQFRSILRETAEALAFNRQRSLLTIVSLAWGVTCFVILTDLSSVLHPTAARSAGCSRPGASQRVGAIDSDARSVPGLPVTLGTTLVSFSALTVIAISASLVPAWKAATLTPVEALRYER